MSKRTHEQILHDELTRTKKSLEKVESVKHSLERFIIFLENELKYTNKKGKVN